MATMRYPVNISKSYLLKLSIPIFFSNISVPLVGLVDTALMGHLDGAKYLAAVGISTSVMTMILWSFGFLRMGTVGLVSQFLGKGDYTEVVRTIVRNIVIASFVSVVIILLKNPIIQTIIYFFNPTDATQILIKQYINIRIFSAPAELIIYVLIGFFLGLQMTKTSSTIVILFSILNIIFSSYLVLKLELGIYGVAFGTVISSYITAAIFLIYSYFFIINKFKIIPRLKKIYVKKKIYKLFSINFDIFLRTFFLTFAFLWVTFQSAKLGEDYLAINIILMQFITLSAFFLDAYAFSTEGVVGFAIGRKTKKGFLSVTKNSVELSFYSSLIISILFLFYFKFIINSLTDLEYIRYLAYGFFIWVIIIPPVSSFCYQLDGIFIGASQTKELRNCMIISVLFFLIISHYLIQLLHNNGLWLSFLLFMIMRALTLRIFYYKILKKF